MRVYVCERETEKQWQVGVCVYINMRRLMIYSRSVGVLPTIPSASDFNTVLSSDQNTMDTHSQHTHSQHSTSQDDLLEHYETNLCPAAVQLADAQVLYMHSSQQEPNLSLFTLFFPAMCVE